MFSQPAVAAPEAGSGKPDIESLIHFGDIIDVDISGSTEYDWRGGITPEGFLDGVDFTDGPVYALCRREREVAEAIDKSFSRFLREPKINVKIIDRSKRPLAFIYGAIKTPHRIQLARKAKLSELIIVSGGISERASGEIEVLRPPKLSCENPSATEPKIIRVAISDILAGRPDANIFILPGDVVTVLEANPVYLLAGFEKPQRLLFKKGLTLLRAVDAGGGLAREADAAKIRIFRLQNGENLVIEADLAKIRNKELEDIPLREYDIIEAFMRGGDASKVSASLSAQVERPKTGNSLPLKIIE